MVDFNKITNDKDFQRLVNHLFAIECNSPAFIPSSPYIGFDGGWDGYFKGFYPHDGLTGTYSIQAKWTQKNFNDAEVYLKQEIQEEVKKAIKNGVDHLRIATQAELRVDQVKNLQALAQPPLKTLNVWHREDLKIRIERQPFLRLSYFGDPQHPMLNPADVYFNDLEKQLSDIPSKEIPTFQKYINEFKDFIKNQDDRFLLIHAPGGFGKSHFLRDLSEIAYGCDPTRQLWMIKPGYHSFETAIQAEIDPKTKYILVLDDADRSLPTVSPLLAFAKFSGVDIKVVLGSRTSGIHVLYENIRQVRISENLKQIKIDEWPKDDLLKLLRLSAGKNKVKDEEIIVNDFQNPYFIVLIGNRARGDGDIDFKKLKTKIIEDIISDTKAALADLFQDKVDEFLIHLSCIVPFGFDDKRMLDQIGLQIDQPGEKIKQAIKRLLDSSILRQVGKSIRFAPDMRGDIYLLYKLEDLDKDYFKSIVLKWIPICSRNIFVNLGSTLRYGQDSIIASILEEFVNDWISKAKETNSTDRIEKIKWLENVVAYVPVESLALINAYFDTSLKKETSLLSPDEPYNVGLDYDDYGPAIIGLIRNQTHRKSVVGLIEKIAESKLGGTYDNYKPKTMMKECVSPLRNSVDSINETLDIFDGWLKNPNKNRASLMEAALAELLGGSHSYTRSYLDKMEFGEKHLRNTPQIIGIRENATSIVIAMLASGNIDLQLSAIDVSEQIGSTRMGPGSPKDLPLAERFVEEREMIIDQVGGLVKPEADFRLLSEIEDLLLGWWLRTIPGNEKGVPILREFPKSPEYEIFRYFSSRLEVIENFADIEKKAPEEKRWSWAVDNLLQKRWHMKAEDFKRPVLQLNAKYDTPEKITEFLSEFHSLLSSINHHMYPLFLTCWVQENANVFERIRDNNTLWIKISERFKGTIDYSLAELNGEHIKKIAGEVLEDVNKATDEKLRTLLGLITAKRPDGWKDWIIAMIKNGSDDVIKIIPRELYFIYKYDQNIDVVIEILLLTISSIKEIRSDFVDSVSFVVTSLKKELYQQKDSKELIARLYDLIRNRPKLEWHDEEIIEFCINDLVGLVELIDYRLKKSKEVGSYSRYEAIPYDGIKHLKSAVKSYADYELLMAKVLEWHNTFSEGVESYEVQKILKPVLMTRDLQNNSLYVGRFIGWLLENKDINSAFTCAQYLPLTEETKDLFMRVAAAGVDQNMTRDIESLLFTKTMPEGGWTSSSNQPPPALVQKKEVYESMQKDAPGALKNLFDRCVKSIQQSIQDHLDRDKEFMAD